MKDAIPWRGLAVFGLELEFETKGRGNAFPGSAWRGLLGHALANKVCVREQPQCSSCPLVGQCAYPRLFKPLDTTALAPFWVHGWRRCAKGWRVGVRWVGEGEFARVLEWLDGLAGEDKERRFGGEPATLSAAFDASGERKVWSPAKEMKGAMPPIALVGNDPPPQACLVTMVTPLVSKHTGDPLYGALATRVQRLVQAFGSGETLPRPVLPWRAQVRDRRERAIPLDRRLLAGEEFLLELTDIDPFAWELLQAGRELHAGGQAGLGCGRYLIEPTTATTQGALRSA